MNTTAYELREPMDALAILITQIQTGTMVVTDTEGRIRMASESFTRLHTSSMLPGDLVGWPLTNILTLSGTVPELYEEFFKSADNKSNPPMLIVDTLQGERKQVYIYRTHSGQDTVYLLVLKEVRKELEPILLQQFPGTFMKTVNLGIMLFDMDFSVIEISDKACSILGVEREAILNQTMEDVFAAVPVGHQLVQRTILDGMVVRNHAVSWMNDQKRYELLMDSNLLKDNEGNILGAYVIFKDVSNLRSLEEQVQRSDRLAMIGQIAAGTAHEIRNPLTSIKGFLQMFKKTLQDKGMDKEHSYTEIMLSEIDRINELVSEFLLLSKPKNISFDLVEVSTVLREILPIINNEAILHGAAVQFQSTLDVPRVVANRELLKQVFLNICKNGIEAMSSGGTLTISERVERDHDVRRVNIDIHDTGPGIPAFLVDKIFDPFFTTKENGTGLGLSVCQRIIHDIGGVIRVSSKGYGTTFTVSIPYNDQ
ncbi:ATP-binding protein [Paenibacillus swuensis]